MDPLSALGLAGNVIQFVDFGIKLVSSFNQVYRSAEGALQENIELSEMATRLRIIASQLDQSTQGSDPRLQNIQLAQSTQSSDPELQNIARSCRKVSSQLLELLAGLQNQATQHRKLNAVRITLKSVMKEGVIRDFEGKLHRLQQQLNTRLLVLLHGSNSLLTTRITEIIDANQRFQLKTTVSLDALIRKLENIQALGQSVIYIPEIGQQIDALTEESKLADRRLHILKSLRYNIMHDRYEDVVEAYRKTFQWVVNDSALGFSGWLKSPSARTYWITGKPGSGKSTLMKFIHQHSRTRELLREWAGSRRLVIANHFFWVSGDQLQRSQIGLLRSLLFQILRESPQLIESVCETRWDEDELTWDDPWNMRILSSCFGRLANNKALDTKICLFIDGLDEFDGDHRELIRLLRDLMRSTNSHLFKLCMSSRPWNVFEAEYGGLQEKLNVHELTSNDILSYIDGNLHGDEYLRELFAAEHYRSSELIQMISSKAQGVFLWVHYVVRLLLKTAVDCPTMSDLVRMVDGYPDELDPLFERILASIPKVYHRDTAQIIHICLESLSPPPLVVLRFAERGIGNENYVLHKDMAKLTEDELEDIQIFKQRLKGKCMDFIEVHRSQPAEVNNTPLVYFYQVDFFHRTVRDFLHMKKGWITEWAGETFDVHLAMCRASLVLIKTLVPLTFRCVERNDLIARGISQFFASAHVMETERGLPIAALLEQLDEALKMWIGESECYHWSNFIYKVFPESDQPTSNTNLLSVAVQTDLLLYVREKIKPNQTRRCGRLLHQALVTADLPLVGFSVLNPDVIRHLLDCGADPDESYNDLSAWCGFLLRCLRNEKLGHQCLDSASVETIELLLQYGANADAVFYIPMDYSYRELIGRDCISVEEMLTRLHPNKSRLHALLAQVRTGTPEQQDTGTTSPDWDSQSAVLDQQGDVELRSTFSEPASETLEPPDDSLAERSGGVDLRSGRSQTRGEGLEPEIENSEPGKRKKRRRLWAVLKRILT